MNKLSIYTDGGSRGNPGPAAIGVIILDEDKKIVKKYKRFLGKATNNYAEYNAVITALRIIKNIKPSPTRVSFFLDSELVCKQINREYRIKSMDMKVLNDKVNTLIASIKTKITFHNVPRENEHIEEADALVNEALDAHKH
jgi:ribonuclease HI